MIAFLTLTVDAEGVIRSKPYGQVLGYVARGGAPVDRGAKWNGWGAVIQGTIVMGNRGTRAEVVEYVERVWRAYFPILGDGTRGSALRTCPNPLAE